MDDKGFYVVMYPERPGRELCHIRIDVSEQSCYLHTDLRTLLEVSTKEYYELIYSFGAEKNYNGLIFSDVEKAKKLVDYLNNKYLLILRLTNKV